MITVFAESQAVQDIFIGAAFVAITGGLVAGIRLIIKVTAVAVTANEALADNTKAVQQLSEVMGPLHEQVADHENRLGEIEPVVFPGRSPRRYHRIQGDPA